LYGYTFELSKVKEKQHSLPSYFSRVQTLTNKERYTTPELQRLSYDLTDALMSYREEEKKAKEMFMSICLSFQHDLLHFASSVAMIDVLIAAAESAHEEKWIKPQIVSAGMSLLIKDGKHPIIASQNHYFVSNTLALSEKKTVLLTGPNMGGKSTFMRQNALIIILAHIGFFVPASLVEIPIMDNIFTRIGASDSAEEGKSTFFVELEEVNRIITYASRFSFVIIDEIGRGTSTYDGIALAASIISFLLDEKKPYMICSTHYHELADFIDEKKVSWGYMGYHMTKEHIQFLYTLLPGIAQQSMGIALAEKIGLPKMITSQARQYVDALEKKSFLIDQKNNNQNKKSEENICSLSSKGLKETLKKIGAVDIDDLTPRKAFDLIAELKNTIDISLFEKD
jgi:DNA mismatch repair protein MutS